MGDDVIELDDYRPIWEGVLIEYLCCGFLGVSVHPYGIDRLECPICHTMTTYTVNEGERIDPDADDQS